MSDEDLDAIEAALGLVLPTEYRRALRELPGDLDADVRAHELYDSRERVIEETLARRNGASDGAWKHDYVVIGDSGCGDLFFLDVSELPAAIYCLSQETGAADKVAASAVRWVERFSR
jgi:hypothetical protein